MLFTWKCAVDICYLSACQLPSKNISTSRSFVYILGMYIYDAICFIIPITMPSNNLITHKREMVDKLHYAFRSI